MVVIARVACATLFARRGVDGQSRTYSHWCEVIQCASPNRRSPTEIMKRFVGR